MTHNTKILKLSSGEEIICNVAQSSENNHISVMQPMKLNAYPRATRNGLEESLVFRNGFTFQNLTLIKCPLSQVIVLTNASYGLSKFYEYCVKKATVSR